MFDPRPKNENNIGMNLGFCRPKRQKLLIAHY